MVDLSIIIISFNTRQITEKCLETIFTSLQSATNLIYEVIVIDNNSADGSVQSLKKINNPHLKIIESKENLGFAKGNNEAVKQARGKYILFLNSDIEVLNDAISLLYDFYTNQAKFQFVGGKLHNENMTSQASAGPFYNLINVFVWLYLRGDYWGASRNSPNKITSVDWVSGACFITTQEYFNKLNGFDKKIFMYMDEVDLFYRARKIGFRVGFYPKSSFIHLGSASSKGRTKPILQVYRGLLYFYSKHYSHSEIMILRFMLKLKALTLLSVGKIIHNNYLTETYEQAYQIAKNY
jgi:GT2 family glycosyltransferase